MPPTIPIPALAWRYLRLPICLDMLEAGKCTWARTKAQRRLSLLTSLSFNDGLEILIGDLVIPSMYQQQPRSQPGW